MPHLGNRSLWCCLCSVAMRIERTNSYEVLRRVIDIVFFVVVQSLSHVCLFVTPWYPSMGFSRQEHWSGLPFPSPMHEREKWKWSRSVMSDSSGPHGLQPTRLLRPWDFPGKNTGMGCHCLLRLMWEAASIVAFLLTFVPSWKGKSSRDHTQEALPSYDSLKIKWRKHLWLWETISHVICRVPNNRKTHGPLFKNYEGFQHNDNINIHPTKHGASTAHVTCQ